jgi:hypothetical protein
MYRLNDAEADLIETLRADYLPFARVTIECCDGVWDVTTQGICGVGRGTGTTFEAAYAALDDE